MRCARAAGSHLYLGFPRSNPGFARCHAVTSLHEIQACYLAKLTYDSLLATLAFIRPSKTVLDGEQRFAMGADAERTGDTYTNLFPEQASDHSVSNPYSPGLLSSQSSDDVAPRWDESDLAFSASGSALCCRLVYWSSIAPNAQPSPRYEYLGWRNAVSSYRSETLRDVIAHIFSRYYGGV
ncbi:hypothetical protein NM688_g5659 [Phlebia brevispora]|uniref:Uncharacterized protein n=1 Tax=Phlebia brevispora TaxID=194682 RepID=A0ACC1SRV5_9APHY|nr:hypothetical protein NM688_g5659 [Phlebia brevispora]